MRVPLDWLTEYCAPALDAAGVAERLTMTGTKVEAVSHHGVGERGRFVVGRVLSAERHPDADRLRVCTVSLGEETAVTIVCGAPNVAAGQTVAVARPGAVMADGTRLGEARLRGVTSQGMILAEDELGIGTDHAGIIVLGERAPGTPLAEALPISTPVLELEITPNRPDCLGVYGVARELHAATGAPLAPAPWADGDPGTQAPLAGARITVKDPDLCPRFTARVFEGVRIAPSPAWLKARLMAAGQRPINNVVDITNYAMLLTGQPLHAFDLDRVAGARLEVRRAGEGEQLRTLDGQLRTLDHEMLLIEDGQGPTSIAGVMGGARSEVAPDTTRVLMEVATWNGPNIHRTSSKLGLRSEASSRFEKGLAPEQAPQAQAVSTRLMLDLTGATLVPGAIDIGGDGPAPAVIRLRERRVGEILGEPVARSRQDEILRRLEFGTTDAADGLDVSVPAFRRIDVTREADLIEEVARIDGLDRLPATLPKRRGAYGRLSREQRLRRRAVDALVGRGLYEIVSWTFTSPALLDRLRLGQGDKRRETVEVRNPLSADQSLLRPMLLGSLLDVARHNTARGMGDLRLLEQGTVFSARGGQLPRERRALGVLIAGRVEPPSWGRPASACADFFAAKGFLEALAGALRAPVELRPASDRGLHPDGMDTEPFLHPGRAAAVLAGGERVGWLGELHPAVAADWDLEDAAAFELDLGALIAAAQREPEYEDLISFPSLRLDIAVTLPDAVPAGAVLASVRSAAGGLLDDVSVFDVYTGPQVGEGRRSLALALAFRAPNRTLADEDVAPLRERIVAALGEELGGELRA